MCSDECFIFFAFFLRRIGGYDRVWLRPSLAQTEFGPDRVWPVRPSPKCKLDFLCGTTFFLFFLEFSCCSFFFLFFLFHQERRCAEGEEEESRCFCFLPLLRGPDPLRTRSSGSSAAPPSWSSLSHRVKPLRLGLLSRWGSHKVSERVQKCMLKALPFLKNAKKSTGRQVCVHDLHLLESSAKSTVCTTEWATVKSHI